MLSLHTYLLTHMCTAEQNQIKQKISVKRGEISFTILFLTSNAFYLCVHISMFLLQVKIIWEGRYLLSLRMDVSCLIVGLLFLGGTKINLKDFSLFKGHL